jgi:hypothetical protein
MTPETAIKKAIKQYLRLKRWFVYSNLQGLGCETGLPDLTAIKQGRVLMIEVKTPKGRQSTSQISFQGIWELYGGEYMIARSVDDLIEAGL